MTLKFLRSKAVYAIAAAAALAGCAGMRDSGPPTTFFITSANPGTGGDLGGLAGADAICNRLATEAGVGGRNWHAYLSTQATGSAPAVNARDRIGKGPWTNAKGVVIAKDLAQLHGQNNINKETALTERGEVVPASGDPVNKHDIMTGSRPDGTAFTGPEDRTCGNYTKSGDGNVMLGHHDRNGTNPDPIANASWNSSHPSAGCSIEGLAKTGSAGYLYCFATN